MKGSKLPLYALFAVIALAIVYAIANPPAPELPGPVGAFPTWKSIAVRGEMTAQATNQDGTMWAGAWSGEVDGSERSALRIIDFNGFSGRSVDMGKDVHVQSLSWADAKTLRAMVADYSKTKQIIYIDAETGKKTRTADSGIKADAMIISWPAGSDKVAAYRVLKSGGSPVFSVMSDTGKAIGQQISFTQPEDSAIATGMGLSADGSLFVFTVSDPAAKDGKSFYLADTKTGVVTRVFDLGDVPGRIEGMWTSDSGILIVCRVRVKNNDKLQNVLYDPASGKLTTPRGVDLAKWPSAPKSMAFTTFNGGFEFDLVTGKTKSLYDARKKDSMEDKQWRDFLRDSRIYKLKSGGYITVSETGGLIDIRELKPDGTISRALIARN